MGSHQKHAALAKPDIGLFGRNEIAIMGTPCGNIKKLSGKIIESLKNKYSIGYIDADHKSADQDNNAKTGALNLGADVDFVDKINYLQINRNWDDNSYQLRKAFADQDLVIVNGNHFKANKQILVIDPKKDLSKKLDRINEVSIILLKESGLEIPEFLKSHIENIENVPVYDFEDYDSISGHISNFIESRMPKIKGLVLAGGKSTRMNKDKGLIDYHGMPQREYAAKLLKNYCEEVYISCRPDQADQINGEFPPLPDSFEGLGPFGGIASAFRNDPDSAWLVVACDLPYLDETTLDFLISNRNPSKTATSFWDTDHKFPEPLITIWEPRAYSELLYFLTLGHSCPRKVLINSNTEILDAPDNHALTNVNYPEEMDAVLENSKN